MTSDYQHEFLQRCEEAHDLVDAFLNDKLPWGPVPQRHAAYPYSDSIRASVKDKIRSSVHQLAGAIECHGLEEIAILYNGGKDCLVMLLLLLTAIHIKFRGTPLPPQYKLDSIYIHSESQFPELLEFIELSTRRYHLNPILIRLDMKEGFEKYLLDTPQIKAIVVGVRHLDPHGAALRFEHPTDGDWPRFLRIHPILDWKYVEIWDFLVGTDVDYCRRYDMGFTSLGGVLNTLENDYLRLGTGFLPAYMLREDADDRERDGRLRRLKNDLVDDRADAQFVQLREERKKIEEERREEERRAEGARNGKE